MIKLELYNVDSNYVKYLQIFDKKVADNSIENKKSNRKFIGIILEVNGLKYIAPLTSPKPKHKVMKNSLDFLKLENGELGAINFNNMLPIIDGVYHKIDINTEINKEYKNLLKKQLSWCNEITNKEKILKNAEKLHKEISIKKENSKFWNRSCNFILLEIEAKNYERKVEKEQITIVLLNDKTYNPLTGKTISLCPGSQFPDKYKSAAWLSKGQILKNQDKITIKDCEIPLKVRLFSRNAEKQIVMKDILFYNTEQLSIDKELIKEFKEPIKTVEKEPVIKEKDRGWER